MRLRQPEMIQFSVAGEHPRQNFEQWKKTISHAFTSVLNDVDSPRFHVSKAVHAKLIKHIDQRLAFELRPSKIAVLPERGKKMLPSRLKGDTFGVKIQEPSSKVHP